MMHVDLAVWIAVTALALAALLTLALLWRRATRRVARGAPAHLVALQNPVVLVHGLGGFNTLFRRAYFRGVAKHLQPLGVKLYSPALRPLGSIAERAAQLAAFVEQLQAPRVVLIGHSMGGLDARFAVSRLGLAARVACVLTIGSPHRGTPIADALARGALGLVVRVVQWIAKLLGLPTGANTRLGTEAMARFNAEVPDVSGVDYYSIVGTPTRRSLGFNVLLRVTHWYLQRSSGPNDGMVPCSSQRWGRVLCETDAGHWAQIGWSGRFDAPRFFEQIVRTLETLGY